MLIRPQQALQLARNNSKLLIFNDILKIYGIQASLSDLYQEKEDHPYSFVLFHTFSRPSYLTRCRGSKLALLHRVKKRKTPSLSAQASFAPFSLSTCIVNIVNMSDILSVCVFSKSCHLVKLPSYLTTLTFICLYVTSYVLKRDCE